MSVRRNLQEQTRNATTRRHSTPAQPNGSIIMNIAEGVAGSTWSTRNLLGDRTLPDAIYTTGVNSQHLTVRAQDRVAIPFSAAWLKRDRLSVSQAARRRGSG